MPTAARTASPLGTALYNAQANQSAVANYKAATQPAATVAAQSTSNSTTSAPNYAAAGSGYNAGGTRANPAPAYTPQAAPAYVPPPAQVVVHQSSDSSPLLWYMLGRSTAPHEQVVVQQPVVVQPPAAVESSTAATGAYAAAPVQGPNAAQAALAGQVAPQQASSTMQTGAVPTEHHGSWWPGFLKAFLGCFIVLGAGWFVVHKWNARKARFKGTTHYTLN